MRQPITITPQREKIPYIYICFARHFTWLNYLVIWWTCSLGLFVFIFFSSMSFCRYLSLSHFRNFNPTNHYEIELLHLPFKCVIFAFLFLFFYCFVRLSCTIMQFILYILCTLKTQSTDVFSASNSLRHSIS